MIVDLKGKPRVDTQGFDYLKMKVDPAGVANTVLGHSGKISYFYSEIVTL
jgi:hypothetical protein